MDHFTEYRQHVGADLNRFFKTTLFQSPRMLLGMDCLEPGQRQPPHKHAGRDKFYYVIEGRGAFTIGEATQEMAAGGIAWASADQVHSVVNTGTERLVMLIGMALSRNSTCTCIRA